MRDRQQLRDHVFLSMCEDLKQLATCKRGSHACIIVNPSGLIVGTGYNGSPSGEPHCYDDGCIMEDGHCVRCIHAESNAVILAGENALFGTAYVTARSCIRCANLLVQARISEIVYNAANTYTTDIHLAPHIQEMLERQHIAFREVALNRADE